MKVGKYKVYVISVELPDDAPSEARDHIIDIVANNVYEYVDLNFPSRDWDPFIYGGPQENEWTQEDEDSFQELIANIDEEADDEG